MEPSCPVLGDFVCSGSAGVFNGESPLCTGTGLSVGPVQSTQPYIQQTTPQRRHYGPVLFLFEQITPQRCCPTATLATVDL